MGPVVRLRADKSSEAAHACQITGITLNARHFTEIPSDDRAFVMVIPVIWRAPDVSCVLSSSLGPPVDHLLSSPVHCRSRIQSGFILTTPVAHP